LAEAAPPAPAGRLLALAVLAFGACVIGLSPILVRLAETGPAAAGFWRLAIAAPLLVLLGRRGGGGIGQPSRLGLLAGAFFAVDLGFWHYGIRYTSVANATVLSNGAPLVVIGFAWIFLKERPRVLFLLAVAAAIGGAMVMALAKGGGLLNQPLGDALSASTALWYGLYLVCIGQGRRTEDAGRLMLWSTLSSAPLLLLAAMLMRESILPAGPGGWAACVGLGLMHVAGQGSIAWALGRLPTATASVVMLLQPVVAGWLGWLVFAEPIGPLQALGAAVTLAGVVLAQAAAGPRTQPPSSP
jgi:drug/metabolite transporter (DMT)-like permease